MKKAYVCNNGQAECFLSAALGRCLSFCSSSILRLLAFPSAVLVTPVRIHIPLCFFNFYHHHLLPMTYSYVFLPMTDTLGNNVSRMSQTRKPAQKFRQFFPATR